MTPRGPEPGDDAVRWVDERLGAGRLVKRAMRYVFPEHWSFLLGEIALYA
ncbi:MAG: ubiquinol-cytochrome c reductase cytochrome b subunit, partial [Solirubrobacteraceae bacterium]|nr:ubiquinol-cytochrome c reductase cytochrome b subunit [Solirubrobacteraceae bacterium]